MKKRTLKTYNNCESELSKKPDSLYRYVHCNFNQYLSTCNLLSSIIKNKTLENNLIMSKNYNFNSMMKSMLAMLPFITSMASAATIVERITMDELLEMEESGIAF